mmetsp:Transcript_15918/g.42852  ORF Transcript_15918/g.42852 Transcript_15918/m.42852 type:complete len:236 (-) Transcript_15918:309-1016(-)
MALTGAAKWPPCQPTPGAIDAEGPALVCPPPKEREPRDVPRDVDRITGKGASCGAALGGREPSICWSLAMSCWYAGLAPKPFSSSSSASSSSSSSRWLKPTPSSSASSPAPSTPRALAAHAPNAHLDVAMPCRWSTEDQTPRAGSGWGSAALILAPVPRLRSCRSARSASLEAASSCMPTMECGSEPRLPPPAASPSAPLSAAAPTTARRTLRSVVWRDGSAERCVDWSARCTDP